MNKANVLKAMIVQHIRECRTLALRFPSFLPIRFPIFALKRPREAQNDPANSPPDRPKVRPPSGACLIPSLGSFWSLSRALFGVTFSFCERANRPQNVQSKYLYFIIQNNESEAPQNETDTHRHTHKFETATSQKQNQTEPENVESHANRDVI